MIKEITWPQASHTLRLIEQQFPNPEHIKQLHGGLLTDLVKAIIAGTLPSREEIQKCYGIYGGTTHLKLISGAETLILDPTDGKSTIAKAEDTFSVWIDPAFQVYGCNVKSEPAEEQEVVVHEIIKDGDFRTIFDSLAGNLNSLCLTQHQIIHFVRKYRNWLIQEKSCTFFLFKVYSEFFVVRVDVHFEGGLLASAYRLSSDIVWGGDGEYPHRVVSPQKLK